MMYQLRIVPIASFKSNIGALSCIGSYQQSRNASITSVPIKKSLSKLDISQIKKGQGGRSSFSGIVATVFGSTGFLGRYVVNRLGRIGSQIILPYRGDYYDAHQLKLCGDLGQILFLPFDLKNEETLYKAMKYSNVVINTIGKDYETSNWKFSDVHIEGARNIARIATECGVEKLIHVSALSCEEHPKPVILKKGSQFLASKWYGEQAVKDEFPNATIIRPSDMFGNEDRFLRLYSQFIRREILSKHVPIWNKGIGVEKQPVCVSDVANGIVNAILDEDAVGRIYEAVGPRRYKLQDLVDYVFRMNKKEADFKIVNLKYKLLYSARISIMEKFLKYSHLSWEKMEKEVISDMLTGERTLEDLGVNLTNMEDLAFFILRIYKDRSYYVIDDMPFEETSPPQVVN